MKRVVLGTNYWQMLRFGIVGATTFLLSVILFPLLEYALPNHLLLVATLSYLAGIVFHFVANKFFTFNHRKPDIQRQILRYSLLLLMNYLISMFCLEVAVRTLHLQATLAFGVSLALTTGIGYVTLKHWVFSKTDRSGVHPP